LDGSRNIGICAGAIPLSEYLAYFEMFDINDMEERDEILYVVGEMDEEYLTWLKEKQEKNKPK
jgi:hypothetical protein